MFRTCRAIRLTYRNEVSSRKSLRLRSMDRVETPKWNWETLTPKSKRKKSFFLLLINRGCIHPANTCRLKWNSVAAMSTIVSRRIWVPLSPLSLKKRIQQKWLTDMSLQMIIRNGASKLMIVSNNPLAHRKLLKLIKTNWRQRQISKIKNNQAQVLSRISLKWISIQKATNPKS